MLVNTRTGLPLPYFKFFRPTQISANVGGNIVIPVSVQNLGARDAWNLALPAGSWTWYYDADNNGSWDPAIDTQMTTSNYDSDGNGAIDTGLIDSGYTKNYFAVRTAVVGDVGTNSITVTATSAAQPTAATASQSITDTIKTASDYCPGCTSTVTYLHNYTSKTPGTSGATKAVSAMAQDLTAPTNATLYDYSTDLNATAAGRTVLTGGSGVSENNLTKVAVWQRQLSNTCTLPATAVASVTIWAMPTTGSSGAFDVYIGSDNNTQIGGFASAGKTSYSSTAWPGGFQQITLSIPINTAFTITKNNAVEVRIEVPGTSASSMLFAYDTTTYTANAHLPFSSSSCL
jgi:hypothetical protein